MTDIASYTQWRAAVDKAAVRRVTWVCGGQRVLVEEVVDTVRARLGAADLDYVSLTAGEVDDRSIWNAADQHPLGPVRLLLVRQAQLDPLGAAARLAGRRTGLPRRVPAVRLGRS